MITKYYAVITVVFTLAILFSSQTIGDKPRSALSRSFVGNKNESRSQLTDNVSELGSQQNAVSDRSEGRLSSDGTMSGVTLRRTRVYDAKGLQEPKSVLWKTPKLFTLEPEVAYSIPNQYRVLIRHDISYYGAKNIITAGKEAYFMQNVNNKESLFVIDLQAGEAKKTFRLLGDYFSLPTVAGDMLFVGAHKGGFYAFDRRDWKSKWEIDKKDYDFSGGVPAVADGLVYFGGSKIIYEPSGPYFYNSEKIKGSLHAVDALTGTQKWIFTINGFPTPVAVADGVIYFGDQDRHLFALNAKDGKEIWRFKASDNIVIPAIMDGRVFFSDRGGNLYAVDLANGKAVWKAATKNKVATVLAVYNKMVYYGGEKNGIYAVDALTGQEKWAYRTTKRCPAPVAANGVIYVGCEDSTLLAIDAESGHERWKYITPSPPYSHPVIGNGVIYYLDEEGVMYALGSA